MSDLDDPGTLSLDSLGVLRVLEEWPAQCRAGWDLGRAATGYPEGDGLENVVVLGMGGSGSAGDMASAALAGRLAIPLLVTKDYSPLPPWVGRNSLAVAISYSGDTEETLDAFGAAQSAGARTVSISSGGALEDLARSQNGCHVRFPGGGQPRASLGYLLMPLLAVLGSMGVAPDLDDEVEETMGGLDALAGRVRRNVPVPGNPAKELAARLAGKLPVIYGGSRVAATAAYRFKCDLNEYAKSPAFSNVVPEMNHNEIVGWETADDGIREKTVVVFLRDEGEHERVAARMDITKRLVEPRVGDVVELTAQGSSPLARLLSLVYLTQTAAIYTGFLQDVDPGPVGVLESLKSELAELPGNPIQGAER